MSFTKVRIAALSAVAVAGMIMPVVAQAQRYYARQTIAGVSSATAPQYPGRWQSATSTTACMGGERTTTVTGTCTGGACDPADDPSSVKKAPCTFTCTGWTVGQQATSYKQVPAPTYFMYTDSADMRAKAQAACARYVGPGVVGCMASPFTDGSNNYANAYVTFTTKTGSGYGVHLASCS